MAAIDGELGRSRGRCRLINGGEDVFALADGRDRALMEDPGGEKCRPGELASMEDSSLADGC